MTESSTIHHFATSFLILHTCSQISYGAVILSFLGAIHWGYEFAGFGGVKGPRRYMMGIFPVLAGWPTLLLPHQIALAAQWATFTALWYIDSRATAKGWAPKWYSTVSLSIDFVHESSS